MPIHVPMVDVAHDRCRRRLASPGSTRRVCSASARRAPGAVPGPICYGRGGTRPTITDANLVLGRLDPERPARPWTGRSREPRSRRRSRDRRSTARASLPKRRLRLSAGSPTTGWPGAIRMVSLARGHDPRDYALFAFGGAGPAARRRRWPASSAFPSSSSRPGQGSPTRSAAPWPTCARTSPAPSTAAWKP